jgi:hypothetical protein
MGRASVSDPHRRIIGDLPTVGLAQRLYRRRAAFTHRRLLWLSQHHLFTRT